MSLRPALYVHVPFCAHKCGYCDFNSWAETRREPQIQWLEALERQLGYWSQIWQERGLAPFETVFWGGGTPSLLQNDLLIEAHRKIRDALPFDALAEWTVECNPETLNEEKFQTLSEAGVNRISLGIQSFQDKNLERLERQARRERNLEALGLLKKHWAGRWSLDLMFGLPDQNSLGWQEDIELALSFSPEHISAYQLTLSTIRSQNWKQPPEDSLLEMFLWTEKRLAQAGLQKYEVSNFAVPGHESRHNLKYWRMEPFLGLGPGAAGILPGSYVGLANPFGAHIRQAERFETWAAGAGQNLYEDNLLKTRTAMEHVEEMLMMGLRLKEGISLKRLGWSRELADSLFLSGDMGLNIEYHDGYYRCTPVGEPVLDWLLPRLFERLEKSAAAFLDSASFDPTFR